MRITIVGAGLTGSVLTEAMIAHIKSNPIDCEIVVVDYDKLEPRNCVGNHVSVDDYYGVNKAKLLSRRYRDNGIETRFVTQKLTENNAAQIVGESDLIIGAVDNPESRVVMWNCSRNLDIPYIDIGINAGNFNVTWTCDEVDTMPYSPRYSKEIQKVRDVKRPPCELVASRVQGVMAAEFAAKSIMAFLYGIDPAGIVESKIGEKIQPGDMVGWYGASTPAEFQVYGEYLGRREQGESA